MIEQPRILKPTVLSVSLLTVLAGAAVSPALGQIKLAFPDSSDLMVQMILTLPPLMIIPFSLLTGYLTLKFKKRHLLLVGLLIYFFTGVGGAFANSMIMLLVTRALFGIGTGLIAPLSQTIIADFYSGDERADMLGKSSAVATLGGIIMPLLSGWLAVYNWRFSFSVYAVSLFVLALIWRFLPEPPRGARSQHSSKQLPKSVYVVIALTFLLMVVFYLIPTKAALFLQETRIGNAGQAGLVIAVMNVAAFLVGLRFGWMRKKLGNRTPVFGLFMLTLGLGLAWLSFSLILVLLSMFVAGAGIGTLMPTVFLTTANLVPSHQNASALSGINSAMYLGQFASPVVFSTIGLLFPMPGVRENFLAGALIAGMALIFFVGWNFFKRDGYKDQ